MITVKLLLNFTPSWLLDSEVEGNIFLWNVIRHLACHLSHHHSCENIKYCSNDCLLMLHLSWYFPTPSRQRPCCHAFRPLRHTGKIYPSYAVSKLYTLPVQLPPDWQSMEHELPCSTFDKTRLLVCGHDLSSWIAGRYLLPELKRFGLISSGLVCSVLVCPHTYGDDTKEFRNRNLSEVCKM
jgi:hypothetical protein